MVILFLLFIEWVVEDVSESPKETLSISNHFAEFSGYLIDFRGFRKLYFLGFFPKLNAYSLFVNIFSRLWFPGWNRSDGIVKGCLTCHGKFDYYNTNSIHSRTAFFLILIFAFYSLSCLSI